MKCQFDSYPVSVVMILGIAGGNSKISGVGWNTGMLEIGYRSINRLEHMLPNGKKLVQIDFER